MSLESDYADSIKPTFIDKISTALQVLAFNTLETPDFENSTDTQLRRLVEAILKNPRIVASRIAPLITANSNVSDASDDSVIQIAVDTAINKIKWMFESTPLQQ